MIESRHVCLLGKCEEKSREENSKVILSLQQEFPLEGMTSRYKQAVFFYGFISRRDLMIVYCKFHIVT